MDYKLFLMLIWLTGVAAVFGTLVTSNIIYGIIIGIVTIIVTYSITRAQKRIKKKVKAEEKPQGLWVGLLALAPLAPLILIVLIIFILFAIAFKLSKQRMPSRQWFCVRVKH